MNRYFKIYGWLDDNRTSIQYVDFNLIFGSGYATFKPTKKQLHQHSNFKSIINYQVIDGLPIYNENKELIGVEY